MKKLLALTLALLMVLSLGTAAFAGEERRHAAEARALLLDCFR